jgi:hypothetical protein
MREEKGYKVAWRADWQASRVCDKMEEENRKKSYSRGKREVRWEDGAKKLSR